MRPLRVRLGVSRSGAIPRTTVHGFRTRHHTIRLAFAVPIGFEADVGEGALRRAPENTHVPFVNLFEIVHERTRREE